MQNRSFFIFGLSLFILCSCKDSDRTFSQNTYIGGEIVNPNVNYVLLGNASGKYDTIYLDTSNRFIHRIENVNEGLYTFRHTPEGQRIVIEKGDSILLRLNTLEFDESLVFSGNGARKNNFLIESFLKNELERKNLNALDFQKAAPEFWREQDSLLEKRLKSYYEFEDRYEVSDLSKKILKNSFLYDFYTRYESYLYHRAFYNGFKKPFYSGVPKSFLSYRDNIDLNDKDLNRLYAYNRFLDSYFNNLIVEQKMKFVSPKNRALRKIEIVDSLIKDSIIKNNLFRGIAINFILNSRDLNASKEVGQQFLKVSQNKTSRRELEKLIANTNRIQRDSIIPDQKLISSSGATVNLHSLFNKPVTALYFWSIKNRDHYMRAHNQAKRFRDIYPGIDFIAINTDDDQMASWLQTIKRNHFNLDHEYEFKFPKQSSEELVIYNRNKVILVDDQGKIIDPNANLFSSSFEKTLFSFKEVSTLENQ